jgi:hypothetical protein
MTDPDLKRLRKIALALPGVEEGTSYGTLAFRVGGKFLARLHQDGASLVIKVEMGEREMLMELDPETFYITEHYRHSPMILVRLAKVDPAELRRLFEQAWRREAPKRLAARAASGR